MKQVFLGVNKGPKNTKKKKVAVLLTGGIGLR
jgi:hypothetical protein